MPRYVGYRTQVFDGGGPAYATGRRERTTSTALAQLFCYYPRLRIAWLGDTQMR